MPGTTLVHLISTVLIHLFIKYLLSIYCISRTVWCYRDRKDHSYVFVLIEFIRAIEVNHIVLEIFKSKC